MLRLCWTALLTSCLIQSGNGIEKPLRYFGRHSQMERLEGRDRRLNAAAKHFDDRHAKNQDGVLDELTNITGELEKTELSQ